MLIQLIFVNHVDCLMSSHDRNCHKNDGISTFSRILARAILKVCSRPCGSNTDRTNNVVCQNSRYGLDFSWCHQFSLSFCKAQRARYLKTNAKLSCTLARHWPQRRITTKRKDELMQVSSHLSVGPPFDAPWQAFSADPEESP